MSFLDTEIVAAIPRQATARAMDSGPAAVGRPETLLAALRQLDLALVSAVLGLSALGLWLLGGAVVGSPVLEAAAGRQIVWCGIALCAMAVVLLPDYQWLHRLAPFAYVANLGMLVFVLVAGTRVNGSLSWIRLGPASFQPSETMKIVTTMMLASWFSTRPEGVRRWRDLIGPGIIAGLPVMLILRQPDLGTASLFAIATAAIVLWAGIRRGIFLTLLFSGLAVAVGSYPFLRAYQKERLLTFLDPTRDPTGSGYNVIQSMVAVGSGGITGRGWGEGTQAVYRYLPEAHTDFVFAASVEQLGLLGAFLILGLYGLLFWRILRTVEIARDRFGGLLVVGLGAILAGHIAMNTAMTVGLFPVTGLPLPFLSYGGTFLLATYVVMGLILNVSMRRFLFVGR